LRATYGGLGSWTSQVLAISSCSARLPGNQSVLMFYSPNVCFIANGPSAVANGLSAVANEASAGKIVVTVA
jgi:hypothetical protein